MGVKNELFPLKCIWLLLHCLALPRWQVITQLEYLQTNVLMFRWRTFIFDVKFRLDCTTIGPIDSFQFKIVWLYRGWRQMAALYIQLGKAYYIRILTLKLDN
jgi:hypothetical protein